MFDDVLDLDRFTGSQSNEPIATICYNTFVELFSERRINMMI